MEYNDYQVRKFQDSVYYAFKKDAKKIHDLCFSHAMYFTYKKDGDTTINGKFASPFEQEYSAIVRGGIICSKDLCGFIFYPSDRKSLGDGAVELSENELKNYKSCNYENDVL